VHADAASRIASVLTTVFFIVIEGAPAGRC